MASRGLGLGLLTAGLLLPALVAAQQAGAPDPRQLDARIERLERLMDNQALLDMMRRLEALERDVRILRGDSETSQHELENLRNRQRDLYLDVDQRLQALEEGGPLTGQAPAMQDPAMQDPVVVVDPARPAAPAASAPARATGDEQEAYRAAFELLREGRYQQSVAAFQGFLSDYPQSSLAANAQYWLGEAKYVSRDFEGALAEFGKVINDYPQSNKLPDAQLKLGFAQYELGQFDRARETLEQVARDHGGSAVARLAEQRLQRMREEGR